MITKIPFTDRINWLELRRNAIGGSDAAAILGLSKWSSPLAVYADKLGLVPEREDNEAMRQGRDLEEYVASRFTEATGLKVRRENHILVNDERWVTPLQAEAELGIPSQTIRYLARSGKVSSRLIGKKRMEILLSDLQAKA